MLLCDGASILSYANEHAIHGDDALCIGQVPFDLHQWNIHSGRGTAGVGKDHRICVAADILYRLDEIFFGRIELLSHLVESDHTPLIYNRLHNDCNKASREESAEEVIIL